LTQKYFDGITPERAECDDLDNQVLANLLQFPNKIGENIERYHFRDALNELMNLARLGNKYLTETEPWKLWKTNPEKVKTILNISLQIVANLAVLSEPFLPFTSAKLKKMLNLKDFTWEEAGFATLLPVGTQLGDVQLLFDRIEDTDIQKQMEKLKGE
jgi:methionyl-tRNA synthetase